MFGEGMVEVKGRILQVAYDEIRFTNGADFTGWLSNSDIEIDDAPEDIDIGEETAIMVNSRVAVREGLI